MSSKLSGFIPVHANIIKYIPKPNTKLSFSLPSLTEITPRQMYDICAVSTYIAYYMSQYWKYPDEEIQRPDVEIFANIMALVWHITNSYNPNVYIYLWIIGGLCQIYSHTLIPINKDQANQLHIGVQFGGQVAVLLLILDLISPR